MMYRIYQPLKIHFTARTICRSRHSELAGTIWFAGTIHFPIATTHEIDFVSCYREIWKYINLLIKLKLINHSKNNPSSSITQRRIQDFM